MPEPDSTAHRWIQTRRTGAFVALAVVCTAAAVIAAVIAVVGAGNQREASARAVAQAAPRAQEVLAGSAPFAVYRMLDRRHAETYGRVSIAPVDGAGHGPGVLAGPSCQRVAAGAGRAVCLDVLGTEMAVQILDSRLKVVHSFDLPGIPSRARISPDGRWAGVTAFIVGHAYAAPGTFSTAATLVDMDAGKPVGNLETDFTVTHDGKAVTARDRNYWGLTFAADGDTFYATLATGGRTWLIQGSIKARSARTIHENVECPSLSPDGTRIGYKKKVAGDPTRWRFTVLDLASGRETPLAETRSIDDQLAWLDDDRLLYGFEDTTFLVNADGSGKPSAWIRGADSATVQEPAAGAP